MPVTLETAKKMLDFYINAESTVLGGKSISDGDKTWTQENLQEIRAGRNEWQRIYNQLNQSSSGCERYHGAVAEFD